MIRNCTTLYRFKDALCVILSYRLDDKFLKKSKDFVQ
jgi:hypothetical protein